MRKMPLRGTIGQIVETLRNGGEGLSVEWQISNFFSLSDKVNDWYESPPFHFSDACWFIKLEPKGEKSPKQGGYINLYLIRRDLGPPKTFNLAFGIKSSDRVEKKFTAEHEFSKYSDHYYFSDICKRSELREHESRLMPNNILRIACNLKTDVGSAAKDASVQADSRFREAEVLLNENQSSGKQASEELQSSLHSLLESEEDCDVTIKVRGNEFRAHRSILRARSPVFRAMFAHDMVEKQRGLVTMEDCDPDTFPQFLEHIYTGSIGMISAENVISLFANSDKYDLKMLKKECTQFMKENMTVASFCDVISLALKQNEKELTERATEFFCSNSLDIVKTAQWQTFLVENPTVGNELLIKLLSKHENIFHVNKRLKRN